MRFFSALVSLVLLALSARAELITIETVTIGDAGNAADSGAYGSVSYDYKIGKYEVTISQYAVFLNSVAASDPYSLYNSTMGSNLNIAGISRSGSSGSYTYSIIGSGDRPITYVDWFAAARFANWVNNGATIGASTETGAYALNGATSGTNFARSINAIWWLPSLDEWYKAAYYKAGGTNAGYWDYATQSDTAPGNVVGSATNQANYRLTNNVYSVTQATNRSSSLNYLTQVGAFTGSGSAYGTYDQTGNVQEWTQQLSSTNRVVMGGRWTTSGGIDASFISSQAQGTEDPSTGFRLAGSSAPSAVPEPSTWAAAALLAGGAAFMRWRKRAKVS